MRIWRPILSVALGIAVGAGSSLRAETETIVVSVPGPRNLSYLPVDLIPKIGADRRQGVNLQLLHTGGGAVALNNLVNRNADFAVAGVPAAMSLALNGGDVVIVAPVDDAPLFVLMVRSGLYGRVTRIADLKGKIIGVNTSTRYSKTTSQQLAEILLKSAGVSPDDVRVVPAGQSWEEQSSLIITGAADAVMGDEPFASRLLAMGRVFFLANLADPATSARIPGSRFLHAALETRSDVIRDNPRKVEKMVAMLVETLQWMDHHSPEEVLDALGVTDPGERQPLLLCLKKYPQAFSRDGQFSESQLSETNLFFRKSNEDRPGIRVLDVNSMIDSRWAGRKK